MIAGFLVMPPSAEADLLLVTRIRAADEAAWRELIDRYEGRLLAFVESRLGRRTTSEDIVQETFIGFLTSLPNYDGRRALESYLFSICAHKLTDHLRREGRRPVLPLLGNSSSESEWDLPGDARAASSIVRSGERRQLEERAMAEALAEIVGRWRADGEYVKIQCAELLFVRGWANKDAAQQLQLSEQQVANLKFDFLARLQKLVRRQGLSADVFPELQAEVP